MDQVIHDVSILNLPVLFGIDRGGLVEDGETHQGVFDIAYLRSVPNFTVLAPKDAGELQDMVYTALKQAQGPVAIRFPRDKAIAPEENHQYKLIDYKKWEVLQNGDDKLAILAYGAMVDTARQALPLFAEQGIEPTIINARCCKPLDTETLDQLINNGCKSIITIEEGVLAGGFGSAVLEWSMQKRIETPTSVLPSIYCLGIKDQFVEHGARSILLDLNDLTPAKLAAFAQKIASKI
jgi:1-deoxy-D-xylulose-5-phosphate synthase